MIHKSCDTVKVQMIHKSCDTVKVYMIHKSCDTVKVHVTSGVEGGAEEGESRGEKERWGL